MYKTIYPSKDSTLYSQVKEQNTGLDQIIEISKNTVGAPSVEGDSTVYYSSTYNSRIFIQFDLTEISSSIVSGNIREDARYYLVLKATEAESVPVNYTLYAYPVSGSWLNGRGFYNNNPVITDGVSWEYHNSKLDGEKWITSSYNANSTGSYDTIPGGGNWYTNVVCSQSFNHELPDIRMEVTSIVNQWLSGAIDNNGFLLKLGDDLEFNSTIFGSIKFFSLESHTIFVPRLEINWDSSDFSGTGSFTEVGSDDFVLYLKNIRESYKDIEKPKIRIGVRDRFIQQTYATSSNYVISKRLPTSSYFQIQDTSTDEVIIPFNEIGTKINCDSQGNYFKVDCNSLMPERYYKFVFKAEFSDDVVRIVDDNYIFKIGRT